MRTQQTTSTRVSRRGVLLGIGTVGLAAAGAGVGTTAYFSDTESFSGNSLQAGEFDLRVHFAAQYNESGEPLFATATGVRDGVNSELNGSPSQATDFGVVVDDLKPGDSGVAEFCVELIDNPGFVSWELLVTDDDENGYTEPEPTTAAAGDVNTPGDAAGTGELADAMRVVVSYTDGTYTPGGSLTYLAGRGDVFVGSLRELSERRFFLDHDPRTPVVDPVPGSTDGPVAPCLAVEFAVPTSVGNEIQTDSVGFDLAFDAVQARHNEIERTIAVGEAEITGDAPVFGQIAQAGSADVSFVAGPDTPPLGDGSVRLTTTGPADRLFLYTYDYGTFEPAAAAEIDEGVALADITTLSYSTHTDDTTYAPALKTEIDPDGPGVSGVDDYATLNFEPYYNNTVTPGSWQTWDVLTADAGLWLTGVAGEGSISDPVTWTRLLELYPDATIRFGFGVGVGSGWGAATMHVDDLRVGVDGQVTTYDFGN